MDGPVKGPRFSTTPVSDPAGGGDGLVFVAADPGALAAMHAEVRAGRVYDDFHQSRRERVAVLGTAAATRLGIARLDNQPAVFIGGTPFTVIGIVGNLERRPDLLLSVIIPSRTGLALYGAPMDPRAQLLIETRIGAAPVVARQAPVAVRPEAPSRFKVTAPPEPRTLRGAVIGDLDSLFLLLAGISLIIGAAGIANTTLVSVLERTGEIGLRRALGVRRRYVAMQFLLEAASLGGIGGLAGTSLGVVTVVLVAVAYQWTAVLAPWTMLTAPFASMLIGLVAGAYPALRAAWIEPAEALRR